MKLLDLADRCVDILTRSKPQGGFASEFAPAGLPFQPGLLRTPEKDLLSETHGNSLLFLSAFLYKNGEKA
jgi:hypothetical protein